MIMINKGDSSLSISTEYRDLAKYDTDIAPYNNGFRFTVSLVNRVSQPINIDPSYFTLHLTQNTYSFNGPVRQQVDTDLGYELCDLEKEFSHTEFDIEKGKLLNLYCPKNNEFKIAGNVAGES